MKPKHVTYAARRRPFDWVAFTGTPEFQTMTSGVQPGGRATMTVDVKLTNIAKVWAPSKRLVLWRAKRLNERRGS